MKLFLDSSTNYLYLALYSDKEIAHYVRNGKNDHSETLIDALDVFLKNNDLTVDELDSVYVGRGPGSYTGVRISGTIAKVLALIKNKPLYSFSTLDLLLASKINEDGDYVAKIVAKKNHSYYKVASICDKKIIFKTEDLFKADDEIIEFSENKLIEVNDDVFNKRGLTEIIIDNKLFQEEDIYTYVPNYLRAEING